MMWQLKPCMSQEFPPILQIFHCPVSLSPLHAVILLLCMCAHTDDTVLIGVRAHLEVFVERCVSQLQSEHRCEFVVVWIFEVDLDDHAASRLSSADGSFSPRSSRGVSGVVHLRSVLKSMERSACQLMWVKLLTVVCVLLLLSFISLLSVSNRTTKVSSISDSEAEISTPAISWRFQQTALFIRHSQPDLLNILFLRNLKINSLCLVDSIYGFMKWRKEISRILSVKTFDSYMSTKQLLSYRFKKQDDGAGMSTSPSVRELQMWSADPPAEVLMRVNRPRRTLKTKEKCPTMQRYRTKQQRELFRCFTVISSKTLKLICLIFIFKHDI